MKIAIIGKPNVGKSTLFNRLCKKNLAITHDTPGVTRDFKRFPAKLGELTFELLDTAGIDHSKDEINAKMQKQTSNAINIADLLVFMIDGRKPLTSDDYDLAKKIRKFNKPILLIANKCEANLRTEYAEIAKLGFGEAIEVSAEHNIGMPELEAAILKFRAENKDLVADEDQEQPENLIKLAFVGRPNAGKSTIYNRLFGTERVIVSDQAGTTRDAITDHIKYKDYTLEIVDTAGLRKKSKVYENIESLSNVETINAIRRSNIVLLIIDSTQALEKQDLSILHVIAKEGKGILIICNKIDQVSDKKYFLDEIKYFINNKIHDIPRCKYSVISAKNDADISHILASVVSINNNFNVEISTAKLNKWLEEAISAHPLPLSQKTKRRLKIKFVRQTAKRPPTFTMFANITKDIPDSYNRYLIKSISEFFSFKSVPIRLKYRKNHNPYV